MTPEKLKNLEKELLDVLKKETKETLLAWYEEQDKKVQEQPKPERWKPEDRTIYYMIAQGMQATEDVIEGEWEDYDDMDIARWENFNCFQTEEEAHQEAQRTRAKRKLEWLARELNKARRMGQKTFYIDFHFSIVEFVGNGHLPLGIVYLNDRADAEFALSQMTVEELEALR